MVTVTIPGLRLVSEANARDNRWKLTDRKRLQKSVTEKCLGPRSRVLPAHPAPLVVTITRIGKGKMDSDNLDGSAKYVRDTIAKWLGRDDSEEGCVEWRVVQRKGPYGVEIRIETAEQARGSRREEVA